MGVSTDYELWNKRYRTRDDGSGAENKGKVVCVLWI